jgi:hypothetical protein
VVPETLTHVPVRRRELIEQEVRLSNMRLLLRGPSFVDIRAIGTVRHRAEVVEYRVEQHRAILGNRLADLEAPVTIPVTGEPGNTVGR